MPNKLNPLWILFFKFAVVRAFHPSHFFSFFLPFSVKFSSFWPGQAGWWVSLRNGPDSASPLGWQRCVHCFLGCCGSNSGPQEALYWTSLQSPWHSLTLKSSPLTNPYPNVLSLDTPLPWCPAPWHTLTLMSCPLTHPYPDVQPLDTPLPAPLSSPSTQPYPPLLSSPLTHPFPPDAFQMLQSTFLMIEFLDLYK